MSRPAPDGAGKRLRVPRASGDEPALIFAREAVGNVFPARAGMSLSPPPQQRVQCVPRASGDEPESTIPELAAELCSPRERG